MGKPVIVTGNLGYLGPLVVKRLHMEGVVVLGVDPGYFSAEIPFDYLPDMQVASVDQIPRSFWEPSAVIHLAAISNDPMGELNSMVTYRTNIGVAAELAEMFGDAKHVFASSASVYGWADKNCVETDPTEPLTVYADSKVKGERVVQMISPNATIIRMGTLWGAAPNFRTDLVVNRFAIEAIKNKEIKPLSNSKRPLLHVNDAAEAFVIAGLANREQYSGIFNVNGENAEIFDVAKRVGAAYNVPVVIDETTAGADHRSYHMGTFQTPHLCPPNPTLVGEEKAMKQLEYSATTYQDKPTRLEELARMLDTGAGGE